MTGLGAYYYITWAIYVGLFQVLRIALYNSLSLETLFIRVLRAALYIFVDRPFGKY